MGREGVLDFAFLALSTFFRGRAVCVSAKKKD